MSISIQIAGKTLVHHTRLLRSSSFRGAPSPPPHSFPSSVLQNLHTPISISSQGIEPIGFYISCLLGLPRSKIPHSGQQRKRARELCAERMASTGVKREGALVDGVGVVRPAGEENAAEAIECIRSGKVIAVPTDTLYGFACDACSMEAVNRIYEIKGRKHTSPLAICVGDAWDTKRFAVTDHLPASLLDSLLPGPVTVVLPRGESSMLEKSLNPGLESIGVRVPENDFIRAVCRGSGSALALTSANLSGHPSSVCIKDFETLWEHCEFVYDGGQLPMGRAGSTVVDLTCPGKYRILRSGSAMEETIAILERHSLQDEVAAS